MEGKTGPKSLIDILPLIFAIAWIGRIPIIPKLWIKKGNTIKSFPVFQALRIIRKHSWELVETEPVRYISRRDALRILILRDHRK